MEVLSGGFCVYLAVQTAHTLPHQNKREAWETPEHYAINSPAQLNAVACEENGVSHLTTRLII